MSIKVKFIFTLLLLALITVVNSGLMWFSARDQSLRLSDGRERFVSSAANAANLVNQVKEMSLHVIEAHKHAIAQTLVNDRSVGQENIKNVRYHIEQFRMRFAGASVGARELGMSDVSSDLLELSKLFDQFSVAATGLAESFAKSNEAARKSQAEQLGIAAEDVAILLDTLNWRAQLYLSSTIDSSGQEVDDVARQSDRLVTLVSALTLLSIATIAITALLLYRDVLSPLYQMTRAMNRLAKDEPDVIIPTFTRGGEIGEMSEALVAFKASRSAHRSAETMRTLLNKMPLGVFSGKPDGTIEFANSYARTMFNVAGKEVRGMHISQFLPGLSGADDIEMALLDEIERSSYVTARRHGGTEFKSDVQMSPADEDTGWLWVIRDISRQVQAEAKRSQLETELRSAQKLESLGTMAGGIAHELNTPIQFVTDNTKFLRSAIEDMSKAVAEFRALVPAEQGEEISNKHDLEYLAVEAPQAAEQSLEGLSRVAEIVLAIKRFSHPSSAGLSENNLNDIVKTTATVSRNQWKYVADLDMQLDPSLPSVNCNASELNQVLINLIVNAAHAIEDRKNPEFKGQITVTTRRVDGGVECWVADNGVGIPAVNSEKIFDLFFTTKQPGRGTGQGLSVVHSIITKTHKGKIWVESEVGRGTTFKFMLPFSGG